MVWWIVFVLLAGLVSAESIFLSDYMGEGETKVYETNDGVYVISLLSVSDSQGKAVFRLNDEMSKGIKKGDSYVFKGGSEIVVKDLVINDAQDTNDEAYYYFYGTGEGVLELKNVSNYVLENNLCNFDGQCLNESKENCCYDCGCGEDEKCVNNKCVEAEGEKEETEEKAEEPVEEKKEEVEEEEVKKASKEKKAAYAMAGVILILVLVVIWFVLRKKRKIF